MLWLLLAIYLLNGLWFLSIAQRQGAKVWLVTKIIFVLAWPVVLLWPTKQ